MSNARTASILGYIGTITVQFFSLVAMLTLFPYPFELPVKLMFLPQMAFARLYYFLSKKCLEGRCFQDYKELQGESRSVLTIFTITAIGYPLLGVLLTQFLEYRWILWQSISSFWYKIGGRRATNTAHKAGYKVYNAKPRDEPFVRGSAESSIELGKISSDEGNEDYHTSNFQEDIVHPVVCRGLSKTYYKQGKPFEGLQPTSIKIRRGEVLGLLGPNGAGKTTLISILTGLIRPTQGEAWICGHHIVRERPNVYRNIGVCPQFDLFWEDLTVEDHLLFYLRLKGCESTNEDEKIDSVCTQVELGPHRHKLAKELSGGMKRRLSLAISLIGDSQAIFLDEPTTGLDPLNRETFWRVLEKVKPGKSIILTTHLMQEADFLSDTIGSQVSY